jgi:RNA polymerase sigma-32 factor
MANDLTRDGAIDRYMAGISRYPLLTRDEETALAERYRGHGDLAAAHRLVVANLRFVVKVAHEFRGYGLSPLDLIQEGNVGLMIAVRKFDPGKGCRLISYAVWWIRAQILEFIMRSWSVVRLGTGRAQRELFFKLRSAREAAERDAERGGTTATDVLAKQFRVAESDIVNMESQLSSRDASLDARVRDVARGTQIDLLRSSGASQESRLSEMEERELVRGSVSRAMGDLNEKERYVVVNRLMSEEPTTLQEIGHHFRISRERARQIERNALRKIRAALLENGVLDGAAM